MSAQSDGRLEDLGRSHLRFLLGLRWAIVLVLSLTIVISEHWLLLVVDERMAWPPVVLLAFANAVVVRMGRRMDQGDHPKARWLRDHRAAPIAHVLFDVMAISVVLGASGGAANPFSAILLVYVAISAFLLAPLQAVGVAVASALAFGALFFVPGSESCHAPGGDFKSHLYGMWVAFAIGAGLVAFFLVQVRHSMLQHAEQLGRLERENEAARKFTSLGTLAAGTAHELGTPLGTIAVVAGELRSSSHPEVADQAAGILAQVARCRAVLERMRPGQQPAVEGSMDLEQGVRAAVASWLAANPDTPVETRILRSGSVPLCQQDLEAAVFVLLDNARTALSEVRSSQPIVVTADLLNDQPFIEVLDEGQGLAPEAETQAGEPFFTTKPVGQGMGLGLFVVRTLLSQVGGKLEVAAAHPRGTSVRLLFAASEVP